MKRGTIALFIVLVSLIGLSCGREDKAQDEYGQSRNPGAVQDDLIITGKLELDFSKHKVTFIELGADRCIPCRAMQPIMREIAREFKGQVQVVFYDVWKDPAPARKYGIQLIPTQVFIDQNGKEFFRHVGFFPKEELLKVLKQKGMG